MKKGVVRNLLAAGGIVLLLLFSSVLYCVLSPDRAALPRAAVADTVLLLLVSVTVMILELRRSMKITLYSYANIGLIGGILFSSVLTAVMLTHFLPLLFTEDFPAELLFRAFVTFPRQFSYWAVFAVIAVCVLLGISNIALIRHEGFRPKNALSILLAVFYIGSTLVSWGVSDLLSDRAYGSGSRLLSVAATVIPLFSLLLVSYFECILAGTAILGWIAVRKKPAPDKDFLIILGCSIDKKGGLLPLLKGRVKAAVRFRWKQEMETGKAPRYIPSGGQGANEIMSEGSAMELYLKTHSAEDDEVFPERNSKNTYENFVFSKKIADSLMPDAKIAFATTNYHILRSGILARRAGIDAEGIAGDTKWYFWPNGFIREFFGILVLNLRAHLVFAAAAGVSCIAAGVIGLLTGLL